MVVASTLLINDLERNGLFLLIAMLIVNLGLCAIHPLDIHSFVIILYFSKPRRVGGVIPHGYVRASYQLTMVIVVSWYGSKKVNNHK